MFGEKEEIAFWSASRLTGSILEWESGGPFWRVQMSWFVNRGPVMRSFIKKQNQTGFLKLWIIMNLLGTLFLLLLVLWIGEANRRTTSLNPIHTNRKSCLNKRK